MFRARDESLEYGGDAPLDSPVRGDAYTLLGEWTRERSSPGAQDWRFARIGQVSIKALRHYDALGLLRPTHIHPESGYRYYDLAQLSDLARILALKDCGFSLDEIAQLPRTRNAGEITERLRARAPAQRQLIASETARLQRLPALLERQADLEAAFIAALG